MENAFPATRQGLLDRAAACYGGRPEYPWRDSPGHAVLRHPENRKWYAMVMDVPRQKLGLPGGGCVDIVNLKCDPILSGSLRSQPGILPAWHMNKEQWISVLLDGTVDPEQLGFLLELSHSLTGPRQTARRAARRRERDWLVPANPAVYDVEQDLGRDGHILWKQTARVQAGDTVYIYMAAPVSAVLYQCTAVEVDLPVPDAAPGSRARYQMRLRLDRRFAPGQISRAVLQAHGVRGVRSARSLTATLRQYIRALPQEPPAPAEKQ